MARTSKISDPNVAKAVAIAYIEGMSRQEMADEFGVKDLDTITAWCRDPRVKAHAAKFAQERVLRITRKVDSEMERRMQDLKDMDVEQILKIRKEYLDRALKVDVGGGITSDTTNDTIEAIENDPELLKGLMEILEKT